MRPSENLTTRAIRLDDPQERARAVELLPGHRGHTALPWLMGELMSTSSSSDGWPRSRCRPPGPTGARHLYRLGRTLRGGGWSASDHTACAPDPDLVARGSNFSATMSASWRGTGRVRNPMWAPGRCQGALGVGGDGDPEYRRRGVLRAAVEPVIAESLRRDVPGVLRTGTRDLADAYVRLFSAVELGNYKLSDGSTVWVPRGSARRWAGCFSGGHRRRLVIAAAQGFSEV